MSTDVEPLTGVLNAVRVAGLADERRIAAATGLDHATISSVLEAAAAEDLIKQRTGRIGGWTITPAGRDEHRRLIREELDALGARVAVETAYERFLPLNQPFKELCTEWQMEGQPRACIPRLIDFHADAEPVAVTLGDALARCSRYAPRFCAAVARVRAGDLDAFTKPFVSSYHDVWMELHQDFLLTLDRQRSEGDGH